MILTIGLYPNQEDDKNKIRVVRSWYIKLKMNYSQEMKLFQKYLFQKLSPYTGDKYAVKLVLTPLRNLGMEFVILDIMW
jgi:hypothetical protein